VDEMAEKFRVSRKSNRWPLWISFTDIACLNAYVTFLSNDPNKGPKRRFIKKIGQAVGKSAIVCRSEQKYLLKWLRETGSKFIQAKEKIAPEAPVHPDLQKFTVSYAWEIKARNLLQLIPIVRDICVKHMKCTSDLPWLWEQRIIPTINAKTSS
jgi:hypothetical protein